MAERRRFDNDPTSVTEARHFTAEVLDGQPLEFVDSVLLMVSELASNAVLHGDSPFEIAIDRGDTELEVSVSDHGRGRAQPRRPGKTELHGRGLQIVTALADSWGQRDPTGDWTKCVWFRLRYQ